MALCFFLKVASWMVEFLIADLLSQNRLHSSSIGTLILRGLYHRASISSTAIQSMMNSEPKVEVSFIFYFLENHVIGVLLRKMIMSVWAPSYLVFGMISIKKAVHVSRLASGFWSIRCFELGSIMIEFLSAWEWLTHQWQGECHRKPWWILDIS